MIDVLLPIVVIGIMGYLLLAIIRLFETLALGRLVKAAMRDHPESVPALAEKIGSRRQMSDALVGWLLIALTAAMLIYAAMSTGDDRIEIAKSAIFPAILGATIIVYLRISDRKMPPA